MFVKSLVYPFINPGSIHHVGLTLTFGLLCWSFVISVWLSEGLEVNPFKGFQWNTDMVINQALRPGLQSPSLRP